MFCCCILPYKGVKCVINFMLAFCLGQLVLYNMLKYLA